MSTDNDALQAMNMYEDAAYDTLLNEAKIDDRLGKQTALVTEVDQGYWPDGEPRTKIKFVLSSANNAKADVTMSVLPTPAQIEAEKSTWDAKKKRGIAGSITLARTLAKHYGKTKDTVQPGDSFRVEVVKTRRDAEGKGGFLRIVAFLPPLGAESNGAGAGGPGF